MVNEIKLVNHHEINILCITCTYCTLHDISITILAYNKQVHVHIIISMMDLLTSKGMVLTKRDHIIEFIENNNQ